MTNPLELLEDPLRALLDFLHDHLNLTYGWSIVVLTVIVRLCLLPLVVRQYKSMRAMQLHSPQLKELQRKHKGDRQKLQAAMMEYYKEHNINPFASCLPLVAQLPIFIALYYVLRKFSNQAHGGDLTFMWVIPNVGQKLTEIGWGAGVIVGIYGLSQLLSTELSATPNMSETQRRIMRFLPIAIVIFVFQFPVPSGLVLYWMTTNLWTCGQQLVMKHRIGPAPSIAKLEAANKRGSRTPPREATPVAALVPLGEGNGAPGGWRRRRRPAGDAPAAVTPEVRAPARAEESATALAEEPTGPAPTAETEPAPTAETPPANGRSSSAPTSTGSRRRPRPRPQGGPSRPAKKKRG